MSIFKDIGACRRFSHCAPSCLEQFTHVCLYCSLFSLFYVTAQNSHVDIYI